MNKCSEQKGMWWSKPDTEATAFSLHVFNPDAVCDETGDACPRHGYRGCRHDGLDKVNDQRIAEGRSVYTCGECMANLTQQAEVEELAAAIKRAERLQEALLAEAGDTPGPDSKKCWCNEDDARCRNRAWCVQARTAKGLP